MTTSKRTTRGAGSRPDNGAATPSAPPQSRRPRVRRRRAHRAVRPRRCERASANRRRAPPAQRTRLQRIRRRRRRRIPFSIVTHRSRRRPTSGRSIAASSRATRWRTGSRRKRKWISDCAAKAGARGIRLAKNILVGDVGGTHARFAIVDADGPPPWTIRERQDLEGGFPTFLDALRTYFERTGRAASGRRCDCRGRSRDGRHRAVHESRLEHFGRRPQEIRLRARGIW